jgi:hypothetical protein
MERSEPILSEESRAVPTLSNVVVYAKGLGQRSSDEDLRRIVTIKQVKAPGFPINVAATIVRSRTRASVVWT